jgi:hypothetical protein
MDMEDVFYLTLHIVPFVFPFIKKSIALKGMNNYSYLYYLLSNIQRLSGSPKADRESFPWK